MVIFDIKNSMSIKESIFKIIGMNHYKNYIKTVFIFSFFCILFGIVHDFDKKNSKICLCWLDKSDRMTHT